MVLGKGLLDLRGKPAALRQVLEPQHKRRVLASGAHDDQTPEVDPPGLTAGALHQQGHRRREIRFRPPDRGLHIPGGGGGAALHP